MNPRHVISFRLSLIILKTLPTEIKQLYRKYEKNNLKLTTLIAHRLFNETCINIYTIVCVSHYNRNYLEKYIVNQKILMNKMCLKFDFTYAVQILSRSVNPLSYYIYIYILYI